jgi:hypothetical protein
VEGAEHLDCSCCSGERRARSSSLISRPVAQSWLTASSMYMYWRAVHRPARDRRSRDAARLARHPRRPARAAAPPAPADRHDHHRPGLLPRPGLRPVLAAGLPVQPAPRRAARPALLANRPSSRLRPAERARSQWDRPQADHHALGRHPARRRLALGRHRPRLRTAARSARRRQAHAPGPGDRRARPDRQDASPAGVRRQRRVPATHRRARQPHEGRHSVGRVIFHGNRGTLRQPLPPRPGRPTLRTWTRPEHPRALEHRSCSSAR